MPIETLSARPSPAVPPMRFDLLDGEFAHVKVRPGTPVPPIPEDGSFYSLTAQGGIAELTCNRELLEGYDIDDADPDLWVLFRRDIHLGDTGKSVGFLAVATAETDDSQEPDEGDDKATGVLYHTIGLLTARRISVTAFTPLTRGFFLVLKSRCGDAVGAFRAAGHTVNIAESWKHLVNDDGITK